jgi:protease-4
MQDNLTPPVPPPPASYGQPRRRFRWWIPVAVIGGLVLLLVIAVAGFVGFVTSRLNIKSEQKTVHVTDNSVLLIDLSSGLAEHSPGMAFSFGGNQSGSSLFDVLLAIQNAKDDDKIKGIYYRAGGEGFGYAKMTELRDALVDFKSSGKFIYAFIETGSKAHYYLATVADSIFMPTEGIVELNSYGAAAPFLKGLFDKIGVDWTVIQFEEYKSAAEMMSRDKWSEPAKEEVRAIVDQRQDLFVKAIASSRKLDEARVRAVLDSGIYLATQAKDQGFIDGLVFESTLRDRIRLRMDKKDTARDGKLNLVTVSGYMGSREHRRGESDVDESKAVGIVYASGAIQSGKNGDAFSSDGIYSKDLIRQLKAARDDDDVKVVILRIDSPGGSVIASEEIENAILDVRNVKPVYASMSDVAASGGYYIAMCCDSIIAHPSTITGSIGVIMAIPNIAGTMGKLGVTVDTISTGRSSQFMNGMMPFSETDKAKLRNMAEPIYKRFVQKVADYRKKSFDDTRALAKGRVWTGEDAKARGLVDMSGGLMDAIKFVKKRLGMSEDQKIAVKRYPEEIDNIAALLKMFGLGDKDEDSGDAETSLQQLLQAAMGPSSPVEQIVRSLPASMQTQLRHLAAMADIAKHEKVMSMHVQPLPQ